MNTYLQPRAILQGCLALILLTQATAQKTNQTAAPDGAAKIPVTASSESVPQVRYPDPDIGVKSLDARKKAQMETVDKFKVFYQFQFTDKVKESGITFVHHAVEDVTKNYMPVHYDHGNGIAVADVDADSRGTNTIR
jgi:hypothetical protein